MHYTTYAQQFVSARWERERYTRCGCRGQLCDVQLSTDTIPCLQWVGFSQKLLELLAIAPRIILVMEIILPLCLLAIGFSYHTILSPLGFTLRRNEFACRMFFTNDSPSRLRLSDCFARLLFCVVLLPVELFSVGSWNSRMGRAILTFSPGKLDMRKASPEAYHKMLCYVLQEVRTEYSIDYPPNLGLLLHEVEWSCSTLLH